MTVQMHPSASLGVTASIMSSVGLKVSEEENVCAHEAARVIHHLSESLDEARRLLMAAVHFPTEKMSVKKRAEWYGSAEALLSHLSEKDEAMIARAVALNEQKVQEFKSANVVSITGRRA